MNVSCKSQSTVPGKQSQADRVLIETEPLLRKLMFFRHKVLANAWQEIKQEWSGGGKSKQTGFQQRKKKYLKDPLDFSIFSQRHSTQNFLSLNKRVHLR